LEIVPPADTEKSPQIMESVFAGLFSFSGINKLEEHCAWRPSQESFSFEMASIEGTVKFFARCTVGQRNNVEAQIYAQYPDAEIREAEEDYTKLVPRNLPNREWNLWGSTMKLVKQDALPIRTYKYFQETVTGKMIDPLASVSEVMGSLGKDQHMWFQVIFKAEGEKDWRPESEAYLEELMGQKKESAGGFFQQLIQEIGSLPGNILRRLDAQELVAPPGLEPPETTSFNINALPPGEQEKLKAVHENISKPAFRTTMRFVYLGKRDKFNMGLGVGGFWGAMQQFSDANLNALIPHPESKTFAIYYFDEPRMAYRQRRVVQDYRDRGRAHGGFIFNTEELATVFHFPDMSVKTPTVQRIEAKKGEAPTNLPVDVEFEAS